jgi:large repetitive protein
MLGVSMRKLHSLSAVLLFAGLAAVGAAGDIITLAGNGAAGTSGDNGPATAATMSDPTSVAADAAGNIYIADYYGFRIRKVDSSGTITTFAGTGVQGMPFHGEGGPATAANLGYVDMVTTDSSGNVYFIDTGNDYVRKVNTATGTITTVAGNGQFGQGAEGVAATGSPLWGPSGLAVDTAGNIYISEYFGQRIRKVSAATGTIQTIAGNGIFDTAGDGGPALSAAIANPRGLVLSQGNLYIASACRVRRVHLATSIMATHAGGFSCNFAGDGGPATSAGLESAYGLAANSAGGIFIAGYSIHRIRYVDPAGIISTVAGTGVPGFSGDGGSASLAQVWAPRGVAADATDRLLIADWQNKRIRRVEPVAAPAISLASNQNPGIQYQFVSLSATLTPALSAGSVEFREGTTVLGTALMLGGQAVFTTSALAPGAHTIQAVFSGSGGWASATSAPLAQTIYTQTAIPVMATSASPAYTLAPITLSAQISPATATGTVSFYDGATLLGTTTQTGGWASLVVSTLAAGSHAINVQFAGTGTYASAQASGLNQVVIKRNTATTLVSGLNPSRRTNPVTFTATVNSTSATGLVRFLDGTTVIGQVAAVNGVAQFTTSTLSVATHSITANYVGDANFNASTSAALSQRVKN